MSSKTLWFLNPSLKRSPQMSKFLPGRMPPEVVAQNYRTAPRRAARQCDRAEPDRHHCRAGNHHLHPVRRQPGYRL